MHAVGKAYAFSQTQRVSITTLRKSGLGWPFAGLPASADPYFDPSCMSHNDQLEWMGYSVRSTEWRFTEWLQWDGGALCPRAPLLPNATSPQAASRPGQPHPQSLDVMV